jgi:hypothetical protein
MAREDKNDPDLSGPEPAVITGRPGYTNFVRGKAGTLTVVSSGF